MKNITPTATSACPKRSKFRATHFLSVRKCGRHSIDRYGRKNAGHRGRIGLAVDGRASWQSAWARVDADSSSAGEMVASANRERVDWAGVHACLAVAIGHGLRDDRQRRHLLLSAAGR